MTWTQFFRVSHQSMFIIAFGKIFVIKNCFLQGSGALILFIFGHWVRTESLIRGSNPPSNRRWPFSLRRQICCSANEPIHWCAQLILDKRITTRLDPSDPPQSPTYAGVKILGIMTFWVPCMQKKIFGCPDSWAFVRHTSTLYSMSTPVIILDMTNYLGFNSYEVCITWAANQVSVFLIFRIIHRNKFS